MRHSLVIALLGVLMVFPSCRKGDDDPFFSMRTRKNRLTVEWKVDRYSVFSDHGPILSIRYAPDTGLIYILPDSSSYQRPFQWKLSFDSDGGYVSERRERYPADSSLADTSFTVITKESGTWKFTGGNDVPQRSELLFQEEEMTVERTDQGSNINVVTITGPLEGQVYSIDRLANDELWLSYVTRTNYAFFSELDSVSVRFVKE